MLHFIFGLFGIISYLILYLIFDLQILLLDVIFVCNKSTIIRIGIIIYYWLVYCCCYY